MEKTFYFILFLMFSTTAFAEEFNAGFVNGLWYSQETVFADTTVRIYVAIRNNTGSDLTGTVEFFDGDSRIDRARVSALDGRIIESWVDWTPTYGTHTISATLSRTKLHSIGEYTEPIIVTSALAEDTFFVDYDTDNDGVGNETDTDDDGDGISDEIEKQNGTDPLHADIQEDESSEQSEDENSLDGINTLNNNANTHEGLEQYLTPSRADTMLEGITQTINNTKEKLDTYRHSRAVENGSAEQTPTEEIEVNTDGFGEITRSTKEEREDQEAQEQKEANKPKAQKPEGFLGDLFTFIGSVFGGIYTGILATISWLLNYPILIQLFLLFGILFFLYKTAKKLGGRPQ